MADKIRGRSYELERTGATRITTLTFRGYPRRALGFAGQGARNVLHRSALALFFQRYLTRGGLYRIRLFNRRSVTTGCSNCERHPTRRQCDDGRPQNP